MKYVVECEWTMFDTLVVEANSPEEAQALAEGPTVPLPTDGNYVDDSFTVTNVNADEIETLVG
jgi:hypothetical protein